MTLMVVTTLLLLLLLLLLLPVEQATMRTALTSIRGSRGGSGSRSEVLNRRHSRRSCHRSRALTISSIRHAVLRVLDLRDMSMRRRRHLVQALRSVASYILSATSCRQQQWLLLMTTRRA